MVGKDHDIIHEICIYVGNRTCFNLTQRRCQRSLNPVDVRKRLYLSPPARRVIRDGRGIKNPYRGTDREIRAVGRRFRNFLFVCRTVALVTPAPAGQQCAI